MGLSQNFVKGNPKPLPVVGLEISFSQFSGNFVGIPNFRQAHPYPQVGLTSPFLFLLVLNVGNGWVAWGFWDDYY